MPTHQDLMRPVLETLANVYPEGLKWDELTLTIAHKMAIPETLLNVQLNSGVRSVFKDRIGWAITYLNKAGCIDKPSRGLNSITSRGFELLKNNPGRIDSNTLKQFDSFLEFIKPAPDAEVGTAFTPPAPIKDNTLADTPPEILINDLFTQHKIQLAKELRTAILAKSPAFFEQLVVDLMVMMGYGGSRQDAALALGKSGDGGVDGVIKEDRLGLNSIYLQAKRYEDVVIGRPDLQKFASAVSDHDATKGVFITTSKFSKEAREYRSKHVNIRLIDGIELTQLMIEYGLGVKTEQTISLQKLDGDYWE